MTMTTKTGERCDSQHAAEEFVMKHLQRLYYAFIPQTTQQNDNIKKMFKTIWHAELVLQDNKKTTVYTRIHANMTEWIPAKLICL